VPAQIQGPVVNIDGITITSHAATNRDAAYGRHLPCRQGQDGDCWPDLWDHAQTAPGYRDGVNNGTTPSGAWLTRPPARDHSIRCLANFAHLRAMWVR
jgi:hypothetical protein